MSQSYHICNDLGEKESSLDAFKALSWFTYKQSLWQKHQENKKTKVIEY